jgi:peptidoglycan/LPS O-acetylase OafA/YrhL
MKVFSNKGFWVYDVLLPVSCVVATAIVAGLSYELYEKWFLKLKDKFAVIRKG